LRAFLEATGVVLGVLAVLAVLGIVVGFLALAQGAAWGTPLLVFGVVCLFALAVLEAFTRKD
jgi:hypothetical protein